MELPNIFNVRKKLKIVTLGICILLVLFLGGLMPIDYSESNGDAANTLWPVPMYFAAAHGNIKHHLLGIFSWMSSHFAFLNSVFITVSNPEIIKIFGFMVFVISVSMFFEFIRYVVRTQFSWLFLVVYLVTLANSSISFAHPRVYCIFLATFSLFLTYLGREHRQPGYYILALFGSGLLSGVSYQGLVPAVLIWLFIFADFKLLKANWQSYQLLFLSFLIIILIIPVWTYTYLGAPFPMDISLSKILGFKIDTDMLSVVQAERINMQAASAYRQTLSFYFISFAKIVWHYLWYLTFFCAAWILFIRNGLLKLFSFYGLIYITVFLMFVHNSVENPGQLRVYLILLPFFIVFAANIIERLSAKLRLYMLSKCPDPIVAWINERIFIKYIFAIFLPLIFKAMTKLTFFQAALQEKNFFKFSFLGVTLYLTIYFCFIIWRKVNKPRHVENIFRQEYLDKNTPLLFRSIIVDVLFLLSIISVTFYDNFFYQLIFTPLHYLNFIFLLFCLRWWYFLLPLWFIMLETVFFSRIRQNCNNLATSNQHIRTIDIFFSRILVFLLLPLILTRSLQFLTNSNFFIKQLAYLTGNIDLGGYLAERAVGVSQYLNSILKKEDKVLYFFHTQGLYTKPALYQTTAVGIASFVYASQDPAIIMEKLRCEGINFLCVDNKWGISANDTYLATVADITTPIFEPIFFSRHFLPYTTGITKFFLFKINYEGIDNEVEIMANFKNIRNTGFFRFIYESINDNQSDMLQLKSNPYSAKILLLEYEKIKSYI